MQRITRLQYKALKRELSLYVPEDRIIIKTTGDLVLKGNYVAALRQYLTEKGF